MSTRKSIFRTLYVWIAVTLMLAATGPSPAAASPAQLVTDPDPSPPAQPVKLIFIHHSTGENWLTDGYGNLGSTLDTTNYFVSDTNYGWGPRDIGDRTDIPYWTEWFRSGYTATYMNALFNESGQHSSYTRTLTNPGGENQIIMFKSCFPNSALEGLPDDLPDADGWLTVGHAKYVYNQILAYFATRPDKLFVVITAPPLQDGSTTPEIAANARAFNQWLMNDWLTDNGYTQNNVVVFDFYNVLPGPDNHHRYVVASSTIEHVFTLGRNTSYYPTDSGNDHPNVEGSQKATTEFVPLLNIFYHRWINSVAPGLLLPLNGGTLHYNRPTFDWSDISSATGYQIQVSRNNKFTLLVVNTNTSASDSTYTPTSNLPANTLLYWRVRAKLGTAKGAWSSMWTLHTSSPPSVPSLLAPADNALTMDLTPLLDWSQSTGATFDHYQIQLADNPDFTGAVDVDIAGVANHAYTPTADLNTNTKYYWHVRSWNTAGDYSAWSALRTFRESILPPGLADPIGGITVGDRKPVFDWTDVIGATNYKLQVSLNGSFSSLVLNLNVTPSTYTPVTNLAANKLFYWRVKALGPNGPSAWSAVETFHTP